MSVVGRAAKDYDDFFSTTDPCWWKLTDVDDGSITWLIRHPGTCHGEERHGHGQLSKAHHVEEHEDGTISVMPQPGNSNSILCSCGWHGYINRGVWEAC